MRTGPHDGGHGEARNPVPERKWRVKSPHRPRFPVTCLALDAKRALCSPSLDEEGATDFGDSLARVWAGRGLIPARLDLLQELQRHLRCLVRLGKHGHCRLLQDLTADHL